VKDAKSAVRWIRKNALTYNIDPERIAAGGGSAGGHIAAATGTSTAFEEDGEDKSISSWPNLLVLFNPVIDNGPDGYGHSRVKGYHKQAVALKLERRGNRKGGGVINLDGANNPYCVG